MAKQEEFQPTQTDDAAAPKKRNVVVRAGGFVAKDLGTTVVKSVNAQTVYGNLKGFKSIIMQTMFNKKDKGPKLESFRDIETHYGLNIDGLKLTYKKLSSFCI